MADKLRAIGGDDRRVLKLSIAGCIGGTGIGSEECLWLLSLMVNWFTLEKLIGFGWNIVLDDTERVSVLVDSAALFVILDNGGILFGVERSVGLLLRLRRAWAAACAFSSVVHDSLTIFSFLISF